MQPVRDLDQIGGFLASGGPATLFDLPWMPLYLGLCFAFHPWLGFAALTGRSCFWPLPFSRINWSVAQNRNVWICRSAQQIARQASER